VPKKKLEKAGKIPALNVLANKVEFLDESEIANAVMLGTHTLKKGSLLNVKDSFGTPGTVPAESAAKALRSGFKIDTFLEREDRRLEKKFGDRPIAAAALGGLSGASFGISSQILEKSGLVSAKTQNELTQRNKGAELLGEITGIVGPALLTGGTSLVAKGAGAIAKPVLAVSKAGKFAEKITRGVLKSVIKETGTKSFAKRIIAKTLPKAAGSATEGAAFGLGQLIKEDALGNVDLNAENVLKSAGLGALVGGTFGGVLGSMEALAPTIRRGIGGKLSEVTASLKSRIGREVDKNKAIQRYMRLTPSEVRKLEEVSKTKLEDIGDFLVQKLQLKEVKTPAKLFDSVTTLKNNAGVRIGEVVKSVDDILANKPEVAIQAQQIAQRVIKNLDDKFIKPFGKDPSLRGELAPIKRTIQQWEKIRDKGGTLTMSEIHTLRMNADRGINYARGQANLPLKQQGLSSVRTSLSNEMKEITNTFSLSLGEEAQPLIFKLIEANKEFSMSARMLPFIKRKADKAAEKDFLNTADIFLGAVGAVSAFDDSLNIGDAAALALGARGIKAFLKSDMKARMVILSNIEKQSNKVSNSITSALNNYFGKTTKTLKRAAVPGSVIINTSFDKKKPKKNESKVDAFKRVSAQIQDINANHEKLGETFNIRTMRMRQSAPIITQSLQVKTIQAMIFLDSKLPKNNSPSIGIQAHLEEFEPSSQEIAKFEKYLEATLDPVSVIQDLAEGKITREGVEALRTVYPMLFQEVQQQVLKQLAEAEEKLPYNKRLELGILLDIPTDPSLIPDNIQGLQAQFDPGAAQTGAAVTAQGVVNPTTTGITGIDAAKRSASGTESFLRRRQS